jgi:hypothetical protein
VVFVLALERIMGKKNLGEKFWRVIFYGNFFFPYLYWFVGNKVVVARSEFSDFDQNFCLCKVFTKSIRLRKLTYPTLASFLPFSSFLLLSPPFSSLLLPLTPS